MLSKTLEVKNVQLCFGRKRRAKTKTAATFGWLKRTWDSQQLQNISNRAKRSFHTVNIFIVAGL